jgi:hypothetical protein
MKYPTGFLDLTAADNLAVRECLVEEYYLTVVDHKDDRFGVLSARTFRNLAAFVQEVSTLLATEDIARQHGNLTLADAAAEQRAKVQHRLQTMLAAFNAAMQDTKAYEIVHRSGDSNGHTPTNRLNGRLDLDRLLDETNDPINDF